MRGYVQAAVDEFGTIDGFFNNAGIEGRQNLTESYGPEEFGRVVSINLNGVFYGMAAALEVMHRQGHGAIVDTASVGGIRGVGNQSGYAASKHGVVGLTRNSAVEYGQFVISINAIAPGAIMTPMVEKSLQQIGVLHQRSRDHHRRSVLQVLTRRAAPHLHEPRADRTGPGACHG